MAQNTYLDIDTTSGRLKRQSAITTSAGAADANKVVSTGANGKIDGTLIDSTTMGGGGDQITTTEALAAGDWVNIYLSGGVRKCRKALGQDGSRPAHGFVKDPWSQNASATVFRNGTNTAVPLAGFAASDIGAPVFLSSATSGGCAKTAPSATGQLLQRLGYISDVNATVEVNLDMGLEIML